MRNSSKMVAVASGAVIALGVFASAGSQAARRVDEPGLGFPAKVEASGAVNVSAPVYGGRRIDNVAQIVNRGGAVELAAFEAGAREREGVERAAPFMGRPVDHIR